MAIARGTAARDGMGTSVRRRRPMLLLAALLTFTCFSLCFCSCAWLRRDGSLRLGRCLPFTALLLLAFLSCSVSAHERSSPLAHAGTGVQLAPIDRLHGRSADDDRRPGSRFGLPRFGHGGRMAPPGVVYRCTDPGRSHAVVQLRPAKTRFATRRRLESAALMERGLDPVFPREVAADMLASDA